jgi:AcrR family transcriptional regulator
MLSACWLVNGPGGCSVSRVKRAGPTVGSGRERIRRAAYDLFSRLGIRAVGVDAVIAEAGVAKMTLYRNFPSKDDLVLDFLRRREELWTEQWLIAEATTRASEPGGPLLAVFDLLGEWFARPDFEGCPFLAALLEFREQGHPAGWAAAGHLARIRAFLRDQAALAGATDPDSLARSWHILMNGAIIAAQEGDVQAAARAREAAELLLARHTIPPPDSIP